MIGSSSAQTPSEPNPPTVSETFPFLAQVKANKVKVRAGQNKNFESLGEINAGDEVVVIKHSYGWYQLKLPLSVKAYVNADFVDDLGDGIGQVKTNHLNVRCRPATEASSLGQLDKGTLIKISSKQDAWYEIEPPDQSYGWIAEDYLQWKSGQVPPARVIEPPIRNVYKRAEMARQKEEEEQAKKHAELEKIQVDALGTVQNLGAESSSEYVRHQLVVDEKTAYYLKGYRSMIDFFSQQKVHIEGQRLDNEQAKIPTVFVTKITLAL